MTENMDDLWYLNSIIDVGDKITGTTYRKIKIGDDDSRKSAIVKKKINITISVTKIEFHKYTDNLRISGTILEGPEDIPKGSYHTLNVEEDTKLKIIKPIWLKYQLDKLDESVKTLKNKFLICAFDRNEAYFFRLFNRGYEFITNIKGNVKNKKFDDKNTSNFYETIIDKIKEQDKNESYNKIIMASPAFYNEEFLKNLHEQQLKKKITMTICSDPQKKVIEEILQRPEVKKILKDERVLKELSLINDLLKNISNDEKSVYGLKETINAGNLGAIETLLITDKLIHDHRENDRFEKIDKLMKNTETNNGNIHILDSDNDSGKKLDGLGGIAAILRYDI